MRFGLYCNEIIKESMSIKQRFRPLWVTLHWLMALLVFITFAIGLLNLANQPNSSAKIVPLAVHMALGIVILLIVIARYIMRILIYAPPRRSASARAVTAKKVLFLDQLTPYVHPLLYLLTGLMALLGIAIALPANLFTTVFGHSGAPLPKDFYIYPARTWHGALSLVLMLLILQHVLVAIFHQFIKGENYLGRMWFTKK
jgi:cytochrome b561